MVIEGIPSINQNTQTSSGVQGTFSSAFNTGDFGTTTKSGLQMYLLTFLSGTIVVALIFYFFKKWVL